MSQTDTAALAALIEKEKLAGFDDGSRLDAVLQKKMEQQEQIQAMLTKLQQEAQEALNKKLAPYQQQLEASQKETQALHAEYVKRTLARRAKIEAWEAMLT